MPYPWLLARRGIGVEGLLVLDQEEADVAAAPHAAGVHATKASRGGLAALAASADLRHTGKHTAMETGFSREVTLTTRYDSQNEFQDDSKHEFQVLTKNLIVMQVYKALDQALV